MKNYYLYMLYLLKHLVALQYNSLKLQKNL